MITNEEYDAKAKAARKRLDRAEVALDEATDVLAAAEATFRGAKAEHDKALRDAIFWRVGA